MELSEGEKLILIMLSDIYEHLGIKGEIDPKFVKSAICNRHTWGLEWKYPGIFDSSASDPIVSEVAGILDMWFFIEESYEKLSTGDKKRVEIGAVPFGKNVRFPGFDGNNESDYLGTARFLIEDLERFSTFKGRDLNSHAPLLASYRRMHVVFEPIRSSLHGGLSTEQICELLNAQRHPDSAL